ncbi:MAG TPA: hypothetical protein VN736_28680 [Candidatus Limnocylindrales bacterium]|nr:hypothetical protein [Candidatus Limnocylindrales bacterium]
MGNEILRYQQRSYLQIQTAFDAIPNTGGAATVAGSNCALVRRFDTDAVQQEIERSDKTGTLDKLPAQGGRKSGTAIWEGNMNGNGSPGVAPDCSPILQAGFGKVPTIVAATSVAYSLDDLLYYLAAWNFNAPNTGTQQVAFNSLVTQLEFALGGDEPTVTATLEPGWVLDNDQMADGTTDALAKGGLTAFPNEPATPVTNGTFPRGFDIAATIDGNAFDEILSVKIRLAVQRGLRKDTNAVYPRSGFPGPRLISADFSLTDNDGASMRSLKQKAFSRTAINIDFTLGQTSGNTWDFALNNVIVPKPKYGDQGSRRKIDFSNAVAYPSAFNAKDQFTLAIR